MKRNRWANFGMHSAALRGGKRVGYVIAWSGRSLQWSTEVLVNDEYVEGPWQRRRVDAKRWVECQLAKAEVR